jgi:hypothetical protein
VRLEEGREREDYTYMKMIEPNIISIKPDEPMSQAKMSCRVVETCANA